MSILDDDGPLPDLPIDDMIQIDLEVDLGIPRSQSKVAPSPDEATYRRESERWFAELRAKYPTAQVHAPYP